MSEKPKSVVLIDGRGWMRAAKSLLHCVSLLAIVGIGVWLESSALQWIGAILWFMAIIAATSAAQLKCTLLELRAHLEKWESEE